MEPGDTLIWNSRTAHSAPGAMLKVEILGELYDAEVQGAPLYDPDGARMRS